MLAALPPRQVERESERDFTMQLVRHVITFGDWSKLQGTTYKAVRDELWIMAAGHKGKQGFHAREIVESDHSTCTQGSPRMVRIKYRLRAKVWWPDLDKQLEKLVRGCRLRPSPCLRSI